MKVGDRRCFRNMRGACPAGRGSFSPCLELLNPFDGKKRRKGRVPEREGQRVELVTRLCWEAESQASDLGNSEGIQGLESNNRKQDRSGRMRQVHTIKT